MMNISKIRKYALVFRQAIEKTHSEGAFRGNPCMKRFPQGSCGEATDILGEYLLSNGTDDLYYVCGTHYPATSDEEVDFQGMQSHAWISIGYPMDADSLIVDITGDQFKDDPEYDYHDKPVYVGRRGRFYQLFEFEARDFHEYHGIKDYDSGVQGRLFRLYDEIVERISWD